MDGDSSFRSRLRDALRQSAVGRPKKSEVRSPPFDAAQGAPSASRGAESEVQGEWPASSPEPLDERIHYEVEEDPRTRARDEQDAWLADVLGGTWEREGQGICMVVDRRYPGHALHGDREIGEYAEALDRYSRTLDAFDASIVVSPDQESLFSALSPEPDCRLAAPALAEYEADLAQASEGTTSDVRTSGLSHSRTSGLSDSQRQFLFFDLETTGLSGGAGTCPFLIGFGWFDGCDFRTRQYFLSGYGHEAAMLRMAGRQVTNEHTLGSFNGKTFDVPLIHGRYLFHRVASPFEAVRHIDLLHPARRLWRYRPGGEARRTREPSDPFGRYFRATEIRAAFGVRNGGSGVQSRRRIDLSASGASCALGVLEDVVLGYRRTGDVPGSEIPSRYFHYVRSGDIRPLVPVLEHNRLDLVSLAALTGVIARMLEEGPEAARNAHECLALGRMYEQSGASARAAACYERAIDGHPTTAWQGDEIVQREALRRLALRYRRERRYDDAALAWKRLAEGPSADPEALHALAVHHEHRSKDLSSARAFVLRALELATSDHDREALRHRLERIDRKVARG